MGRRGGEVFRIHVSDGSLADLRMRLERTRWTSPAPGAHWSAGTNPEYLRALVEHWRRGFAWRAREAELNALDHRKADVGGARLHFVHVRGGGVPLLLLHGWPDSFFGFHKVMQPLAAAFDLVIPSLPGFAFTGHVRRPGAEPPNRFNARLLWRLMTEVLGYARFAIAGVGAGGAIAQILALEHPEAVFGLHLTDIGRHALAADPANVSRAERKFLEAARRQQMEDGAYALVQAAQPRTLAAALADSPVGLASWLVDRFHAWSDCGGDLDRSFSKDELLTNIMIYWVTETIGSSVASYHAEARFPSLSTADRVEVPVAMALFPKEPGGVPPRSLAERTLNVQRWTEMPRGGHFAPLEQPALYAEDVLAFFRPLRGEARRPEWEVRGEAALPAGDAHVG